MLWRLYFSVLIIFFAPLDATAGVGVSSPDRLWPHGVIPYVIDDSMPNFKKVKIFESMNWWEEAGVTFIEKEFYHKDWLIFQNEGLSCASVDKSGILPAIGRVGGSQTLLVGGFCGAGPDGMGMISHEIGHALGLEHEHCRSDRDKYISVNIINLKETWLEKIDNCVLNSVDIGAYDYLSVMHYDARSISKNLSDTWFDPHFLGIDVDDIGQRNDISPGDMLSIKYLYSYQRP